MSAGRVARSAPLVASLAAWLVAASPPGDGFAATPAAFAPPARADYRLEVEIPAFEAHESARCLVCHDVPGFVVRDSVGGAARVLTVPGQAFGRSVHARLACTQCHAEIRRYPHGTIAPASRARCDGDCHAADSTGRAVTHAAAARALAASVHGAAPHGPASDLPACTSCHGGNAHVVGTAPARSDRAARLAACAPCHADGERMRAHDVEPGAVPSYERSFHFKALELGSTRAAVCTDCHGAHDVRAVRDTLARTHARQLPATCGQDGCHRGAKLAFAASGANHLDLRVARHPVLALVRTLFHAFGALVLAVLGVGVALDALRRARDRRVPRSPARADDALLVPRLTLAQRLQHGALVLAFLVLALSGAAVHFAHTVPAQAFAAAVGGRAVIRALHRGAAALLVATALAHAASALGLLARARFAPARAWPMLPTARDARDWWALSLWYFGLRGTPPEFDRHEFRQKLHYFLVLAGVPVMTATGLMLAFPVFFGNLLPDTAYGIAHLVHGTEASLAIAIFVLWHLWQLRVTPGPHARLLTAWDGRITRAQWREQHAAEAARVGEPPVAAPEPFDPWAARVRLALPLVLALAVLLRVREAVRTPLWFDELFTLHMAKLDLPHTLALLPNDVHPPLPTLLVSLWVAVGGTAPLWLKSLPLLLGVLALLATYGFARSLFGRPVALLATLLLALHPAHVYFSQELRGYGLLTLALLAAAWSAWAWLRTGRARFAGGWVLAAALAAWTHYLSAVVLALLSLAMLAASRTRGRRLAWLAVHAAIALLVAPLLALLPGQLALSHETWVPQPAGADLLDLARKVAFGALYLVPVLFGLAIVPLVRGERRGAARFAWGMATGAIVLTFALSLRGPHLFAARYMYFTLPYWCVLFAAGLVALPWRRVRAGAIVLVALFALRSAILRPPLAEAVDLQRAIATVRGAVRPGDLVFAADPHSLLVLDEARALPTARLLSDLEKLPYFRGGAILARERIVPLDTLRAVAAGRRWWVVHTPEPGRPGAAVAALCDSLAAPRRQVVGMVTIWRGGPVSGAGPAPPF
ncbi:MAG: glycosyltransferase family 39 protein [Candidatus Eisenbacteria bacterium]|uniref:Glycosyltransferase family 39 protein n=1 Tax=Eiseniibacteriota bacterium TaxID=2212470 RepID=A0A933SA71_UNCEI|nr:glycosyltransferase family 39 protein [Candidatus Eisenbacteria bacterium]